MRIQLLLLILTTLLITGCGYIKDKHALTEVQDKSLSETQPSSVVSKDKPWQTWGAPRDNYFSPLTFEEYNSILNDTTNISYLSIAYKRNTEPQTYQILFINNGSYGITRTLSQFPDFKGTFQTIVISDGPPVAHEHVFNYTEIQEIFNYLSTNSQYFFNNEEFEGITWPYKSPGIHMKSQAINFTIRIYDPATSLEPTLYCKVISKGIDEYPGEEHPLYGLIQLLENDFINQF